MYAYLSQSHQVSQQLLTECEHILGSQKSVTNFKIEEREALLSSVRNLSRLLKERNMPFSLLEMSGLSDELNELLQEKEMLAEELCKACSERNAYELSFPSNSALSQSSVVPSSLDQLRQGISSAIYGRKLTCMSIRCLEAQLNQMMKLLLKRQEGGKVARCALHRVEEEIIILAEHVVTDKERLGESEVSEKQVNSSEESNL